jgi:Flp pilus assembly protein TadD
MLIGPFCFNQHFEMKSSVDDKIAHINTLFAASKFEEALREISTLPAMKRNSVALLSLAGSCYFSLGDLESAEQRYSKILEKTPDCVATLGNLGIVYRAKRETAKSIRCFERVIALAPDSLSAILDLSNLFRLDRQFDQAEHYARRAVAIAPRSDSAFTALGSILTDLGALSEAEAAFRSAVTLNPGSAYNAACLGLHLMSMDRWQEGLPLYESRHYAFATQEPGPRDVSFPRWNGESLAGKSLLIWPEQGLGDQIQLVRYIGRLREKGASRITLICDPSLRTLFHSVDRVDAVMSASEFYEAGAPSHDFWTFNFSIPLNLGEIPASIPVQAPYLRSTKELEAKWRPLLGDSSKKKIGLVWQGSRTNSADITRSLPGIHVLEPLWHVADSIFFSLQKDATKSETEGTPLVCLGDQISNFADTAAIVSQLDLVVTVDTSVAHLSGALGKETWVLLPNVAIDWRWKHEGSASMWYPGVLRLFRQPPRATDWTDTIEEVARALHEWKP